MTCSGDYKELLETPDPCDSYLAEFVSVVVALLKGFYPLGAGIGYKIHLSCKECSLPFLMSLC